MNCCSHCKAAEDVFGIKGAKRAIKNYKKKGPERTTNLLLKGVRETGISGAELLDIGAGVGIIHHEMLGKEVSRVTHVDASAAHNEVARAEDSSRANSDLVTYLHGDAVDLAPQLPEVDLVTLDKVICCYPDWKALVGVSASRARELYAITLPRERWFVRLFIRSLNFVQKIRGSAFRVFVHQRTTIDQLLESMGFEPVANSENLAWQMALYRKKN